MSEGELKKRIKNKGFVCLEDETMEISLSREQAMGNPITEMNEVDISIEYEDVKEILDEARKEFPFIENGVTWDGQVIENVAQLAYHRCRWFLKWFGFKKT